MCGFCVVVVVVVNDVMYSRFDFGLVAFGLAGILLSISALNENGSDSVLLVMKVDSLLVTSFDDGYIERERKKKKPEITTPKSTVIDIISNFTVNFGFAYIPMDRSHPMKYHDVGHSFRMHLNCQARNSVMSN